MYNSYQPRQPGNVISKKVLLVLSILVFIALIFFNKISTNIFLISVKRYFWVLIRRALSTIMHVYMEKLEKLSNTSLI